MRRTGTLTELEIVRPERTWNLAGIAATFRKMDRSPKAHEPVTKRNAKSNSTEIGPLPFWVLIFHKTRQPVHHYQLAGREFVSGREAVKVSFEPLKPYKEGLNDWYGTAWVDTSTFQLLRVEAMKVEDHAAFVQ